MLLKIDIGEISHAINFVIRSSRLEMFYKIGALKVSQNSQENISLQLKIHNLTMAEFHDQ